MVGKGWRDGGTSRRGTSSGRDEIVVLACRSNVQRRELKLYAVTFIRMKGAKRHREKGECVEEEVVCQVASARPSSRITSQRLGKGSSNTLRRVLIVVEYKS